MLHFPYRMIAVPALFALVSLEGAACRTPTDMTVHVVSDVPCVKQRGVIVAVGDPSTYESLPPSGQSLQCSQVGTDLYDMGTIVIVPHADGADRLGIRVVVGVDRDAETCSSADGFKGCIVARRLLNYLPHNELTVDVLLRDACKDVPCDAKTTCVDRSCASAELTPDKCRVGCGEGALADARTCDTPGSVSCVDGKRLTCRPDRTLASEDCGLSCSPTSCVAASAILALAASGEKGTSVALVDGDIHVWGDDTTGRLGLDATTQVNSPTKLPGVPKMTQIAATGTSSHVVALDVDGHVWCWGSDDSGECGPPEVAKVATPRTIVDGAGAPLSNVVQVAASSNSTCVRFATGSISCLGGNSVGQLGRGGTSSHDGTTQPIASSGWSGKALDVACTTNTCCVIDDARRVACFGNNTSGQLGAATTDGNRASPTPVTLPLGASRLRGGDNTFCAVLIDGSVWCWGSTAWNVFVDPKADQNAPIALGGLQGKGVVDVAAGMPLGHYAWTRTGVTYGWGTAGLSIGPIAAVPSLSGASAVSVGWEHACALISGAIVCWGDGSAGALGDGTNASHATPTKVKWGP